MTPIERVVEALAARDCNPRQSGAGYSFRCPAHDDRKASGGLAEGADGRALVTCHAGCGGRQIVEALGLTWRELFPERSGHAATRPAKPHEDPPKPGRPEVGERDVIVVYDYQDADGNVFHRVGRTPDKAFPNAWIDPEHGWVRQHPPDKMKVLYNLPAVLCAVERDDLVILCEGEKDADNLNRAFPDRTDYCATTKPGGASSAWLPQYTETLRGARVLVIADNDPAGHRAAAIAVQNLVDVVRKLCVAVARTGNDASDHLEAGHEIEDFDVIVGAWPCAPLRVVA